jgi:hypothetical protein
MIAWSKSLNQGNYVYTLSSIGSDNKMGDVCPMPARHLLMLIPEHPPPSPLSKLACGHI